MFNGIEFDRHFSDKTISINPRYVASVEPYVLREMQGTMSLITMANGSQHIVVPPPSEVTRRLRAGV